MSRAPDPIAVQRAICEAAPRAPDPWAVLALQLLAAGRAAEAVAAAEWALALDATHPAARGVRQSAVEALERGDPVLSVLELTAALHPEDPKAQLELGHAYADLDRPADAERCLKAALAIAPDLIGARARLASVYLSVGIEDAAEHHCRRVLEAQPGHAVACQTLSAILKRRGQDEAAQALLDQAYERQSLYLEPAQGSPFTVLMLATRTTGNVPCRHIMPPGRYTRLVWYMEFAHEAQIATLPAYHVVLNAIGDADLAEGARAPVERFLARCSRPVLNHPDKVARTHRHLTPQLLGDLEDVVVPEAVRLAADDVARTGLARAIAAAGFSPPLLLRPIGSHGGQGLALAGTEADIAGLEPNVAGTDLYATTYCDYRSPDGRFRKGRVIFVDRRPFPYHWAVGEHWMVHYDSAGMSGDEARQAEERRFMEDPRAFLGERAWTAIGRIGERLDLDYCGLDFSVLPDGRVLVFEANATMLTHPEPPDGEFAYKNPAVSRIIEAFQARLAELAAASA